MEKVNFLKVREAFATFWEELQIYATFYQHSIILPAVSNVLVVFELKRDLKYRRHVYFDPVCPHITHQAHADLKSHNEFYEDISVAKGLSREDMFRLFEIVEIQGENKNVTEKIISNRKEMSENRNDTETEYASIKDLLNMHKTPSNETTSCLILR